MTDEAACVAAGWPCRRRRPRMVFDARIHALGAHIHRPDKPWRTIETEDLGESVRLPLPKDWPIHDQGQRGACVAHAAVACLEHFVFARSGRLIPFSEQFIHYTMRQLQYGERNCSDRTWLRTARDVLRADGVCLEAECPYDPNLGRFGFDGEPPSAAASDSARRYRFETELIERPDYCDHMVPAAYIVDHLRAGQAVAISIPVQVLPLSFGMTNWTTPLGRYHGIVRDPSGDCPDGHAICILGYRQDRRAPGGGWFIFRNSWGLEWSSETGNTSQPFAPRDLPGRGYGVLSVGYVNTYVSELLTVKKQI
jgi:hypothetical protein